MDDNKMISAKKVYATLCAALDGRNWVYNRHDDDLVVTYDVTGDDFPMDFIFAVDADRQLLKLYSRIRLEIPEDKRIELAIACCHASFGLPDGSFDFDLAEGRITFRLTSTFIESLISENQINYMISCACHWVDEYNDKFMALAKGYLPLDKFLEEE